MEVFTRVGKRRLNDLGTTLSYRCQVTSANDGIDRRLASRKLALELAEPGNPNPARYELVGSQHIQSLYDLMGVAAPDSLLGQDFFVFQRLNGRNIEGIAPYQQMFTEPATEQKQEVAA